MVSLRSREMPRLGQGWIHVVRAVLKLAMLMIPFGRLNDKIYFLRRFLRFHRRFPSSARPAFNDQLYFMKSRGELLDPLRQFVTDKEYVKLYIASQVGAQYVIPTIEVLHSESDVDAFSPSTHPIVIKPTHWSGRVLVLDSADGHMDRESLKTWLRRPTYYDLCRESNYQFLRPKLIVEEFFCDRSGKQPKDYKVLCFRGKAKFIQVDTDRHADHKQSYYNVDWTRLRVKGPKPSAIADEPSPPALRELIAVSERLAQAFSFVRVDCYAVDQDVRVGELTNCPNGANKPLLPMEAEFMMGQYFSGG